MSRIFAGVLMLLLIPILLVIVLAYLITFRRNLVFCSTRLGMDQSTFKFYKFRTLDGDKSIPLRNREFPFGRFLRKTSLDELPQLWNILTGKMSFVGPRPLPVEYLSYFSQKQKKRFLVKPGLTGWAQVNGRTSIDWDQKLVLDIEYVEKRTFWFDLKILFKTTKVILLERNDNSLEEESFIEFCERNNRLNTKTIKEGLNNPLNPPLLRGTSTGILIYLCGWGGSLL